jgi:hypothetical protein
MHRSQFDREFNRTSRLVDIWLIFVGLITLLILGGFGFIIFKVLMHFGIL